MDANAPDAVERLEQAQCSEIAGALARIPAHGDPLFRELALLRTAQLLDEATLLAAGDIVFAHTETWRAAYERLLASLESTTYRSVAWVRTSEYWCDQPGRRSIRLNYELLDKGLEIERVLILPQTLWRPEAASPCAVVRIWTEQQHYRGIRILLVRESDLKTEQDLISDFGIYGTRAVGEHTVDEEGRTTSFRLSFAEAAIRRAQAKWDRLAIFAIPYNQVIDLD